MSLVSPLEVLTTLPTEGNIHGFVCLFLGSWFILPWSYLPGPARRMQITMVPSVPLSPT